MNRQPAFGGPQARLRSAITKCTKCLAKRGRALGGATSGTGNLNMYASTIGLMPTVGVGIGTTVPSAALHLITAPTANGIINVSNSTTLSSTASSQDILQRWVQNTNNTSVLDLSLVRVSAGSDWITSAQRFQSKIDATWQAYMQFYNYGIQFGAGSSNTSANSVPVAMTIISGGNVGIGTTNPTSPLYVKYGTNADSTGGPSGTWASIIYNATNASGANGLLVKNNWRGAGSTIFECGSDFVGGAYASLFIINGVGSVGIGTTAPLATLHVNGNIFGSLFTSGNYTRTSGVASFTVSPTSFTPALQSGWYFVMIYTNTSITSGFNLSLAWTTVTGFYICTTITSNNITTSLPTLNSPITIAGLNSGYSYGVSVIGMPSP